MLLSRTKLYNVLIVPVWTNGANAWAITECYKRMPNTFEKKVFRVKFGPTYIDGNWRTHYNHELYA